MKSFHDVDVPASVLLMAMVIGAVIVATIIGQWAGW
jgi:hypothetical protein